MTTIADVAFDVPLAHSFAYRVPDGWTLAPGQRVVAPLRGASRVGMIVALRDGADARLKTLDRVVDAEPVLSPGSATRCGSPRACRTRSGSPRGTRCATGRRAWRPARARPCWRRSSRPRPWS